MHAADGASGAGESSEEVVVREHLAADLLSIREGDIHLVENRGSGIDAMLEAMQERGLPAPVFKDKRTSFLVKFYQNPC